MFIVTRYTSPGQYRIQNLVYERFGNTEARLTGWGKGNTGTITGAWSADSYTYRNYPFLNATPNPLVWE